MSRKLNYPKTQGYWVYAHITPEKDVYIGMSQQQPSQRWFPSEYKGTALQTYIERFGWENIEHRVLVDSLSKQQAEQVEDWFITKITQEGFCINKQRSGGHSRDNDEVRKEQKKAYYETNRDKILEQKKVYREEHREQQLEYWKVRNKQRNSTPEGKIYNRVKSYNRYHPDLTIETPMEARTKYLETGYIPSYIKNDDLI